MKDRQSDVSGQQAHIPFISPILHWLAMPGVVFLRSSFGYLYLRPKSVFLACSFTFTIFFIIAWNEPELWARAGAPMTFAFAASGLYVVHLMAAVRAQASRSGEHDTYSGKSHLLRLAQAISGEANTRFEMHLHLWIEPLIVLVAAVILKLSTGQLVFPLWLATIAFSLSAKEVRNYWSEIRKEKRKTDMLGDTKDDAEDLSDRPKPEAPKGTRKPKRQHPRNTGA